MSDVSSREPGEPGEPGESREPFEPQQRLDRARLERVYSPVTWDLYAELDVSSDPCGPDVMYEIAGRYLHPGATVLDAGCRDARHLLELQRRFGIRGIGIDPVARHTAWGRAAVAEAGAGGRLVVARAGLESCPVSTGSVDLVWCRDVLEQVGPLDAALREAARVLRPGSGRMVVYTSVTTPALLPEEARMLRDHLGNVWGNLDRDRLQRAFERAGLAVAYRRSIGSQWRERAEEGDGTGTVAPALLRLARLRRGRAEWERRHGAEVVRHVEANLHWDLFQLTGKLEPVVLVLGRAVDVEATDRHDV